jgi:hypothetical protein
MGWGRRLGFGMGVGRDNLIGGKEVVVMGLGAVSVGGLKRTGHTSRAGHMYKMKKKADYGYLFTLRGF